MISQSTLSTPKVRILGVYLNGMFYKEGTLPYKEEKKRSHHSEPYNSPTHAGGLFAMDREWCKELGWYDPGLWV